MPSAEYNYLNHPIQSSLRAAFPLRFAPDRLNIEVHGVPKYSRPTFSDTTATEVSRGWSYTIHKSEPREVRTPNDIGVRIVDFDTADSELHEVHVLWKTRHGSFGVFDIAPNGNVGPALELFDLKPGYEFVSTSAGRGNVLKLDISTWANRRQHDAMLPVHMIIGFPKWSDLRTLEGKVKYAQALFTETNWKRLVEWYQPVLELAGRTNEPLFAYDMWASEYSLAKLRDDVFATERSMPGSVAAKEKNAKYQTAKAQVDTIAANCAKWDAEVRAKLYPDHAIESLPVDAVEPIESIDLA